MLICSPVNISHAAVIRQAISRPGQRINMKDSSYSKAAGKDERLGNKQIIQKKSRKKREMNSRKTVLNC